MLLWALRTCVGHACDCVAPSHFKKKQHFKYVLTPFKISKNMIEFSARNFTEMLCTMYLRNVKEHDRILSP